MTRPMSPKLADLAQYSANVVRSGLAVGPGGNTSVRDGTTMWISPSGLALDAIANEQWVALDIATGQPVHAPLRPSSEYLMHLGIYRERPDVHAIVHTHPTYTIAVASTGYDTIPIMFPDHVAIAGCLAALEYITPCTPELAETVSRELAAPAAPGLILRNHGLITVGATMREAWNRTIVTEEAARVFTFARLLGTPRILTDDECEAILALDAERYRQQLLRVADANGSHDLR
ncbi:MAG: class II aldolase/adducin family protein [Thermomicrobiales bacterium]